MLKTPRNFKFDTLSDQLTNLDYKISKGDILRISISPNDGFNRINFIAENNNQSLKDYIECVVDQEGKVKLPLVGLMSVTGKSLRELEVEIESLYQNYYVKPFVNIVTMSKRFIVFQAGGVNSRSVKLEDDNLTLFEALAMAGGVVGDGKAYNIKLIRNYNGKTYIFKINLSTIDGIAMGQKRVLPNDVIYIEPRLRLASRAIGEVSTFLSVISTTLLVINLFRQ